MPSLAPLPLAGKVSVNRTKFVGCHPGRLGLETCEERWLQGGHPTRAPGAFGEVPEKMGPGSSQRPCGRRTVGDRQVLTRESIRLGLRKPRETGGALERLPGQIVQASTSGLRDPALGTQTRPHSRPRAERGRAAAAPRALSRRCQRGASPAPSCRRRCGGRPHRTAPAPAGRKSRAASCAGRRSCSAAGMAGGFLLEIRRGTQSALLVIR